MAECKPTDKSATEEVDLTSISSVLNIILGALNMIKKPALSTPPIIGLFGNRIKSGMSARDLSALKKIAMEDAGIPMGDIFADGPNLGAIGIELNDIENVNMHLTKTVVQTQIPPGAIQIMTPNGPATNINIVSGYGGMS